MFNFIWVFFHGNLLINYVTPCHFEKRIYAEQISITWWPIWKLYGAVPLWSYSYLEEEMNHNPLTMLPWKENLNLYFTQFDEEEKLCKLWYLMSNNSYIISHSFIDHYTKYNIALIQKQSMVSWLNKNTINCGIYFQYGP